MTSMKALLCKVQEWCDDPPWISELPPDLDQQTLNVNCEDGVLEISNGNDVPLSQLGVRTIYRFAPGTPGLRARWWGPDAGPHLDPLLWDGPSDSNGFPLPSPDAPDFDVVNTSTSVSDSNSGADAARYGIIDGWIWLPDTVTHLRDNNQNTGELGMVLLGDCCGGPLVEQPGGNHDTNTVTDDRSLMDPVPVAGGWTYIYNPQSDQSAFQGLGLEFSEDNEATWSEVTVTQVEAPSVESQELAACDEIPEGWQTGALTDCCVPTYEPPAEPGGLDEAAVQALIDDSATPHIQPATAIPLADNEVDTAIRTGQVGTSDLYARADHNHAIRRQVHPDWPGVTVNGNVTITQDIVIDRRSTEEWVEFETRTRVSVLAGNNWPIITVPTIAGFQQPIITVVNTYRNQSITYQEDDQPGGSVAFDGAAPVGPYMGIEWSHWSSTRNVYGPFRRENDVTSWFIGLSVKYVRL